MLRGASDICFPLNMDPVMSCKYLVHFCELTKGLSSPTSLLFLLRLYRAGKVSWEILVQGRCSGHFL